MTGSGTPQLTFACCIEYGPLEEGVLRLAASLRRWGGELAGSRIVAVTPRRGPALSRDTRARLPELGVEHVRLSPSNRYSWQAYLNKYFALKEAEARAEGGLVAWLDSDVLVLREPSALVLPPGVDIAACARDKNIGTEGPHDKDHDYWRFAAGALGLDVEALPLVRTTADHKDIRLYWNAGVFSYRPETGFADAWRDAIEVLLDSTPQRFIKLAYWVDQVALGLASARAGLVHLDLEGDMNYGIASHFQDHLTPEGLAEARILHYHDAMRPQHWSWFVDQLAQPRPDVRAWLEQLGPVQLPGRRDKELVHQALRLQRSVRRRAWSRSRPAA